jgi:hypothetical protein
MGDQRFDLAEGDGVLYKGCEIKHWRNVCEGPEDYLSGQVFLHYVRKNGPYANHAGDILCNRPEYKNQEFPFVKNRQYTIEAK